MKILLFTDTSSLQESVKDSLKYSHYFFNTLKIDIVGIITDKEYTIKDLPKADVLISVCYHAKIPNEVLNKYPKAINFHPAPLPKYRGWAVYNFGLYNEEKQWGVTAHEMTEDIDGGDILEVMYFNLKNETVQSLRKKSQEYLVILLKIVIKKLLEKKAFSRDIQNKNGNYYSKKMFDKLRILTTDMDADEIKKRVHAC
jgi:methionyl-tRNA formyltransferase